MASSRTAAPAQNPPEPNKSRKTRERILDAAARVLTSKGYATARLSDVADEAQLQAPAIYYYFGSREDLFEEVMWVGISRVRERLVGALAELPEEITPLGRISAAVELHLRYALAISDYTTAAIRNAGQVPASIRSRQIEEEQQYGAVWRDLIKAAQDSGEMRQDLDPYLARMLVMGALNWTVEWWSPKSGSMAELVASAQSLILNGISDRPGG